MLVDKRVYKCADRLLYFLYIAYILCIASVQTKLPVFDAVDLTV